MKRHLLLILGALGLFSACGNDLIPTPKITINNGDGAPSAGEPNPRDAAANYGNGNYVPYNFEGEYVGECETIAMGMSSRSCQAAINIQHDSSGVIFGYQGEIQVDIAVVKDSYAIAAGPFLVDDHRLKDLQTTRDHGGIDHTGFMVVEDDEDYLRFEKLAADEFAFEGVYRDKVYGKIFVRGSLRPVVDELRF